MPKIEGIELAEKMLLRRPDIPIILCTGYSDKILSKKVGMPDIREILIKPLSVQNLATVVRKVLDETEKMERKPNEPL